MRERSAAPPAFLPGCSSQCGNSQASTIDVVWFLGYSVRDSQAGRSVNTTKGQEVCHRTFPDRLKRTAGLERTVSKPIVGNNARVRTSQHVHFKL